MTSKLFSPIKIRDLSIRNRVFVSPMCQYSALDGVPNEWHFVHLGSRAVGGAGLVMVEATAVSSEGRISPGCTGLWNDTQRDAFKPIAKFILEHGAVPGIQLAHAGRKASVAVPWMGGKPLEKKGGEWKPLAPSPIPFSDGYSTPNELTHDQILQLIQKYKSAVQRADEAGFQVIEIHMAHGYLMNEFLSPLTNHRTDEFGGSFENRTRLPLMVAKAARDMWPASKPLFVRISATDWMPGGWEIEDSIRFAKALQSIGIDLIDCSSGGLVPEAQILLKPGYQVPFSEAIRASCNILTAAVGWITEPHQAEAIIAEGRADVVFLAREILRDPYWPLHAAKTLGVDIPWPKQYLRAKN